jgi:hypothetical protein
MGVTKALDLYEAIKQEIKTLTEAEQQTLNEFIYRVAI